MQSAEIEGTKHTKVISVKKQKKQYKIIHEDTRITLFNLINNEKIQIKEAAKRLGLNYNTSKAIYRAYKNSSKLQNPGVLFKINRPSSDKTNLLTKSNSIKFQILGRPSREDSTISSSYNQNHHFIELQKKVEPPNKKLAHMDFKSFLLEYFQLEKKLELVKVSYTNNLTIIKNLLNLALITMNAKKEKCKEED